jgi:predicted metal-dependent hydrolase
LSGPDRGGPGLTAEGVVSESAAAPPPAFVVRESTRARHVRLVMTLRDGLVVVVPSGFDPGRIPGILERRRTWIERASARAEARRGESPVGASPALPRVLELRCLETQWTVDYTPPRAGAGAGKRTVARERPGRLVVVYGDEEDAAACRAALRRWLARKARTTIVPRLAVLACEHGFPLGPVSVRRQRTRWASCSRRHSVSLNIKLLFLPPELVDYVLLHELCHTVRPDHSAGFWALLSEHEPDYRAKRRQMREAHRFIPEWFEEQGS